VKAYRLKPLLHMAISIAALAVIGAACGGETAGANHDLSTKLQSSDREGQDQTGSLAQVNPDESVVNALSDDVVTRAEYDAAVNKTMACLDGKGIAHTAPVYENFRDVPVWTYAVGPLPERDADESVTEYDKCWMRYERDVKSAWVTQQTGRKGVTNEKGAVACAKALGLNVRSMDELLAQWRAGLRERMPEAERCLEIGFAK
jgi:hypothetical protein